MKRILIIVMTLMLSFTSLTINHYSVHADGESNDNEEINEVVDDNKDNDQEAENDNDAQGDGQEVEEGDDESQSQDGDVVIDENEENQDVDIEEVDQEQNNVEIVEEQIQTLLSAPKSAPVVSVDYSNKNIVFSATQGDESVAVPWAEDFMSDDDATITFVGNQAFVYKNVHFSLEGYDLVLSQKVLNYSNITSEDFDVVVSVGSETYNYEIDLSGKKINAKGNPSNWKFRVAENNGPTFKLMLGVENYDMGEAWIKAFRNINGSWVGGIYTGSHMDILNADGKVIKTFYYGGKTAVNYVYFNNCYWLTHSYALELDARALVDAKVPGDYFKIRVCVPGYTAFEIDSVSLNLAGKAKNFKEAAAKRMAQLCLQAPNDIILDTTDDGDLVISSSNDEWLRNLAKPKYTYNGKADTQYDPAIPAKTDHIGGGSIIIDGCHELVNTGTISNITTQPNKKTNDVPVYKYIENNDEEYPEYAGTVIVPNSFFQDNDIIDGEHTIELSAEAYLPYTETINLVLHNEPKEVDANKVSAIIDNQGNLIITCTDNEVKEDFYDSLIKPASVNRPTSGGHIYFGDKDLYNSSSSDTKITKTTNGVVVESKTIKELFENSVSGRIDIRITAKKYNEVNKSINLPYIAVDGAVADDNTITFAAEKTYTVNTTEDVNWTVKKKVGDQYQEITNEDKITVTPNDNKITIKSEELTVIALSATVGSITDTKEVLVTIKSSDDLSTKLVNVFTNEETAFSNLEQGELYRLEVFVKEGSQEYPVAYEYVSIETRNANIVSIEDSENGIIKAKGTGNTNVIVSIKGLEGISVTKAAKVSGKNFSGLKLYRDNNGTLEEVRAIVVDVTDIENNKTVQLVAKGTDGSGREFNDVTVKYTTIDSNVVSVTNAGVATIKKAGQTTVTATVTSNGQGFVAEPANVVFIIRDLTPKLSSNKVTLNKYSLDKAKVDIASAYYINYPEATSDIEDVYFANGSPFMASFNEGDGYFEVGIADSVASDEAQIKALKGGKYTLNVKLKDKVEPYEFDFTVNLTAKKPSVTTKTSGSFNTFTKDGKLYLDVASKDATINDVKVLKKNESTWATYDYSSDEHEVVLNKVNDKYINSGTIRVYFDGYNAAGYVDKNVSFKTSGTKPTVKLENSSVTIFAPNNVAPASKQIKVRIIDGKKNPYSEGVLKANEETLTLDENGYATLTLSPVEKGKIPFTYQEVGWDEPIKLNLTINVNKAVPTVKLSSSSITLNNKYDQEKSVLVTTNIKTEDVEQNGEIKVYDAKKNEVNTLGVFYENGVLKVYATNATAPGTYSVAMNTKIADIEQTKPTTLRVKVVDSDPKLNLSSSTVKLNNKEDYKDVATITVKNLNSLTYGVELEDIINPTAVKDHVADITYEDGKIIATLNETGKSAKAGTYAYKVTPVFSGKEGKPVDIKVTIYKAQPKVSVSVSGSLNQLENDSKVTGTLKLSNISDTIKDVTLVSVSTKENAVDVLDIDYTNSKLNIELTNRYIVDQTIKAYVNIEFNNGYILENVAVSVKVARKAPTLKAIPTTVNVYDTTNLRVVGEVDLSQASSKIKGTIKEVKLTNELKGYTATVEDNKVIITLTDAAAFKAGSSQTLTLKVDWVGDYGTYSEKTKGIKTTTIKITIKDTSGSIKSK